MPENDLERRIRKFSEVLDEAARAFAHYRALDKVEFPEDSSLAQTLTTLRNAMMEVFIIKWHVLFSTRSNDRHRIWRLGTLGEEFEKALGSDGAWDAFKIFSEKVTRVRDSAVAHIDTFERFQQMHIEGAHWPDLNEAARYLAAAYDVLPGRENGAQDFESLVDAASQSFTEVRQG